MVFKGFLNTYLISAWVFKGYLLKHMQITTYTCIKILKPMIFVSTNQQKREREREIERKRERERERSICMGF